ncbi:MAG: chitobiase/beta-hexosaminidase C-terminal domain-containing protein [Verrucomicrobiia bacterium]
MRYPAIILIFATAFLPVTGTAQQHTADCWLENDSGYSASFFGTQPLLSDLQAKMRSLAVKYNVPIEIIAAVCYQESNLYQYDAIGGQVGFVIHNETECVHAFQTGYISGTTLPPPGLGLMQLTSGTATQFDVNRLISDWAYNLEAGVQVLTNKYYLELSYDPPWMQTLEIQNMAVLENWYYALAGYNGSSSYIDTIYGLIANPPARITGLFTPVTITKPSAVISGYQYPDSFVATPSGVWYDKNQSVFNGTVHVSSSAYVAVTIGSSPSGLLVVVDGNNYTAPVTANFAVGTSHSIGGITQHTFDSHTNYVFASWSDGGSQTHTIVTPSAATTYTAYYSEQYWLDMVAAPSGSGSVTANPIAAWYSAGQAVQLTATPVTGYAFSFWVGVDTASGNTAGVTMNSYRSVTANFIALPTVATPTISPNGGSFANSVQVTLTCTTSGATIRYTTDGNDPTTSSTVYGGAFTLTASATVKAKGFETGYNDSAIASAGFTITSMPIVATPAISPNGGNYTNAVQITLSCTTAGTIIRYTTNGIDPTVSSTVYGGAFVLTASSTVEAYASETSYSDSAIAAASFTIVPAVISPSGVYTFISLAGSTNVGTANGAGSVAQFNYPLGLTADRGGNVYVADTYNDSIRKITLNGTVTTLAGLAGSPGNANGTGSSARFLWPSGVSVDVGGNVFVADTYNDTIRTITPGGAVTTLAGSPQSPGSADGTGGTGGTARFYQPGGVTVATNGNVYVADTGNNTIRVITPAGNVSTLAGQAGNIGSADGTGTNALFNAPTGVAVDNGGNVYVADSGNNTIRKILPGGIVITFAGRAGTGGSQDGTGTNALLNAPASVAVDGASNVYVADEFNYLIRRITPTGVVNTIAGLVGNYGYADGTGTNVLFGLASSVAVDGIGNLLVTDTDNNAIRKGWSAGTVPILVLSTPVVSNGQVQINLTLMTGSITNLTLLQSSQLTGSWLPVTGAALTTNVLGVSYTFGTPITGSTSQFYRIRSP